MADEEIFDDKPYHNNTVPDVIIGNATYKVRNVEIHKTGTTTWYNASNTNTPIVTIDQSGGVTATGIVSGLSGVFTTNMTSASVLTGPIGCTTVTAATSVQAPLGIFASLAAPYKLFDIKHPSPNKEGKRLRHGSLEGPELAVYTRGKNKGSIITLPEYWQDLIDVDSITVHLTGTDPDQHLCVVSTSNTQVVISGDVNLTYHYYIMAERKDVAKLEVEIDAQHDYGF